MKYRAPLYPLALSLVTALLAATGVAGQALTERTPNLAGPWVGSPWHLHFQFAHRFQTVGDDTDVSDIFGEAEIRNYPTFDLALGLPANLMTGVRYSSRSLVSFNQPNEWQPYLKWAPIRGGGQEAGVSVMTAWNAANKSFDAEVSGQLNFGPTFAIASVRGFTDLYGGLADSGEGKALGLAGGAGLRVNRYVTIAGDVSGVLTGGERDGRRPKAGWSGGVHIGIPYTPHTFSIMATNVTSGTLQGASGVIADFPNRVYWGFELTVPFSGFARWGQILDPDERADEENATALASGEAVIEIEISVLSFGRDRIEIPVGSVVRWVNRDPVAHTSTSDTGEWRSAAIGPGETFTRRFTEVGEFPYHCLPHPFMTQVIVVTGR